MRFAERAVRAADQTMRAAPNRLVDACPEITMFIALGKSIVRRRPLCDAVRRQCFVKTLLAGVRAESPRANEFAHATPAIRPVTGGMTVQ